MTVSWIVPHDEGKKKKKQLRNRAPLTDQWKGSCLFLLIAVIKYQAAKTSFRLKPFLVSLSSKRSTRPLRIRDCVTHAQVNAALRVNLSVIDFTKIYISGYKEKIHWKSSKGTVECYSLNENKKVQNAKWRTILAFYICSSLESKACWMSHPVTTGTVLFSDATLHFRGTYYCTSLSATLLKTY